MTAGRPAFVEQLWTQFRPLVDARIAAIEAVVEGTGDPDVAARAAHNLSGALGSYGRSGASVVAAEIEAALLSGAVDRQGLGVAVARLRALIER
jgi:HPt (histidine-containing phosphotransfer) domain-containing protein